MPGREEAPEGYIAWHEWAAQQAAKGHVQERCCMCSKLRFPVEMSGEVSVSFPQRSDGTNIEVRSPVCLKCAPAFRERIAAKAAR